MWMQTSYLILSYLILSYLILISLINKIHYIIILLLLYIYKYTSSKCPPKGVTLAQLVKASVGQADVQRFESHLGITG